MNHPVSRYFSLSNLPSYLSLLGGLIAIFASNGPGNLSVAGGLIAFCALADMLDGKFANLFHRSREQKAFGIQLDSLTDAIVFGLTPLACFYPSLSGIALGTRLLWLAAAFCYLLCAVTRLGAYNIQPDKELGFAGLPTTIAGLTWSSFLLLDPSILLSIVVLLGCGLAMVAPIRIPRPRGVGMAVVIAWAILAMLFHGILITLSS